LTTAIADGKKPAVVHKHFAKFGKIRTLPDLQERGLIHISHGEGSVCKEIAGIDVAVGVYGGFIKRHRARASAKIPGIIRIETGNLIKRDMRQRFY
jgi:hypothetical protein